MSQPPEPPSPPHGRLLGAVLFFFGLAILGAVLAADVGGTPALEAWAYALGLAWAPLLQATGIALFLTGGWMLWRSGHRDEP
jgi:hypothetical protein